MASPTRNGMSKVNNLNSHTGKTVTPPDSFGASRTQKNTALAMTRLPTKAHAPNRVGEECSA
ncbi:hypothetical protein HDF10_000094 [Edaphobacter lichenicola]|uniref:Uncharacterized protein n=1 Tax=Tunturiibacter lichenicola TaxID=2051959 RepID=A0A7W8J3S9_9BACT|nr:hypothetical protein [Edaphobacter lichenicola]